MAQGDKKQIAFVIYPGLTPLDLIGPLQALAPLSRIDPSFEKPPTTLNCTIPLVASTTSVSRLLIVSPPMVRVWSRVTVTSVSPSSINAWKALLPGSPLFHLLLSVQLPLPSKAHRR